MPSSQDLHSSYAADKKQREYQLIEQFIRLCPDFAGFHFDRFLENPDMIYTRGDEHVGFDSVIISEDQATVNCYFNEPLCTVGIPTRLTEPERADKIAVFFENKLFDHWRHYSLPTILVFSLLDTAPDTFAELLDIASRFKLPPFDLYNIRDYYLCDSKRYVKIAETRPV